MNDAVQLDYASPARRTRVRPRWRSVVIIACAAALALAGLLHARSARHHVRFLPVRPTQRYANIRFISTGPVQLNYGSFGGGVVDAARGAPMRNSGVIITVTVHRPPASRTVAGP